MFSGEETKVTLEADNSMAGVLIDRFGKDIMLIPQDGGRFRATVDVAVSDQFLGWIVALGRSSPDGVCLAKRVVVDRTFGINIQFQVIFEERRSHHATIDWSRSHDLCYRTTW